MAAYSMCLAGGALIGALGGSQSAAGKSSPPTAHPAVACSGYGKGPLLNYPTLSAVGKFSCSTGAPSAKATLVLQGFKHRKWIKIESASRTVDALPGKTYVVRIKPIHCSSTPHKLKVRTDFKLVAGPLILHPPPSGSLSTYCL